MIFLLIFTRDLLIIDLSPEEKDLPEEVTVVFPENKPKTIVENINENDEVPDESDLLSDRNSRARNEQLVEDLNNQPMSKGNVPTPNLTRPNLQGMYSKQYQQKKFSKDALVGKKVSTTQASLFQDQTEMMQQSNMVEDRTTNNIYEQKEFSADQLGSMSLSTYAWEWAPYINALKRKLYTVWYTPAAYHQLGLIYGYTIIQFSISKDGKLLDYRVLEHKGHESLEKSSVNAITSVFPFKSLPENFPEENLTIVARLVYPNLRERR
jgi:outer membrane biosynthesis protein TonB